MVSLRFTELSMTTRLVGGGKVHQTVLQGAASCSKNRQLGLDIGCIGFVQGIRPQIYLNGPGVLLLFHLFCAFCTASGQQGKTHHQRQKHRNKAAQCFLCIKNSSQLLGSCRFAAKLLWPTGRTSPPARVCALKPAHGNDAAISACVPDTAKRAQHNRDMNLFYHYQEGFSTNFHIFIRKKHARPISLRLSRQDMDFFCSPAAFRQGN